MLLDPIIFLKIYNTVFFSETLSIELHDYNIKGYFGGSGDAICVCLFSLT